MLKIATSELDVTPIPGSALGFTVHQEALPPRDPLFGRLFLVDDGVNRNLAVALDYGGLLHSTQRDWQRELGAAVGIAPERVLLHCVHQHDAPFIDVEAAKKIAPETDFSWVDELKSRLLKGAATLVANLREVAQIGWSETRVAGYASNRRVVGADGAIAVRCSRCSQPDIKNAPAGIIDPMLRTLGFYDAKGGLLASWSFYATHPQVANTGKRYSADAPGEALRLLRAARPGAVHAFFNGCFGNVTAGRYANVENTEGNLKIFGAILFNAIHRNLTAPELETVTAFEFERVGFPFPARRFTAAELAGRGQLVALALTAAQEYAEHHPETFTLTMLKFGSIRTIFMAGELFVEYQLYLQSLIPDEKLGVVGNCGDDFFYIGTEAALADPAGYETTSFCRTLPEFEASFKCTAAALLEPCVAAEECPL